MQVQRVIVAYWKQNTITPLEVFSSLKNLCLVHKEYNYNTLSNYLSKRKVPFETEKVRIERKVVISRPSEKVSQPRQITPVVRKVVLKDADDAHNNFNYWLSKSPSERMAAVTFVIFQSLKEGERLDKRKIVKRKIKE